MKSQPPKIKNLIGPNPHNFFSSYFFNIFNIVFLYDHFLIMLSSTLNIIRTHYTIITYQGWFHLYKEVVKVDRLF